MSQYPNQFDTSGRETYSRRLVVHIPPSLYRALVAAARTKMTTPSSVTRAALVEKFERERRSRPSRQAEHQAVA